LGLEQAQYFKMANKSASRSHCWSRSGVRQLLCLLMSDLQLSRQETTKILLKYPQLLNYRVSTLLKRVEYLRDDLGLNVARMILKRPMVMTYSVQGQLKPTATFLQSMGSADWTGWQRMVETYPQLLTHSGDLKMKAKLKFLVTSLQLDRKQDAVHMVSSFPPIFWLRKELLQEKMDFLKSTLQLDSEELQFLITSFPQLLGLSIGQNIQPKLIFLLQHLTMEQLKEFIAYQPSLLAYSLENRLRPRIELLQKNAIAFGYSPPYLMSLTDTKFQQWYVRDMYDCSILYEAGF